MGDGYLALARFATMGLLMAFSAAIICKVLSTHGNGGD